MFSAGHMEMLLRKVMDQLGMEVPGEKNGEKKNDKDKPTHCLPNLTPSQMLVTLGLLSGALSVDSVLIDKDQIIQIVLSGSLKRKTQLEKVMDQVGEMPFDEVMKAVFGRY